MSGLRPGVRPAAGRPDAPTCPGGPIAAVRPGAASCPGGRVAGLLVLLAAAVLVSVSPTPWTALAGVLRPTDDPTGPLLALVAVCAWLCAAALLATTGLAVVGRLLPGDAGHTVDRVAVRCTPPALRRLADLALGAALATATLAGGPVAWAQPAVAGVAASVDEPAPRVAPPLDLDWPTGAAVRSPAPVRAPVQAVAPVRLAVPAGPAAEVVVHRGDCLWGLARTALGPTATNRQVARAWPSWWSANRAVIGDDPDLIQPGMHLRPPTA